MHCPNCSEEIKDTAKWCGHCGHKIEQAAPPPEPAPIEEVVAVEEAPVQIKPAPEPKAEEPVQKEAPPIEEKAPEIKPEPVTEKKELPAPKSVPVKIKAQRKKKKGKSATKPAKPAAEKPAARDKKKRVPVWAWIIIAVFLIVGAVIGVQFFKSEEVTLAWGCPSNVVVSADTPLKISYGYWGYLAAYHQQNYDSIDFQLYIDGTRYYGERIKKTLPFSDAPCLSTSRFDAYWQENSAWIYDVVQIDGLPAGEYQVDVFTYSDFNIVDGMKDDSGNLIHYGPGLIVKSDYILTVR